MEHLTDKVIDVANYIFLTLIQEHPNETLYAFILYADEDGYTILPAANSVQIDKKRVVEDKSTQCLNSGDKYQILKRYG